MGFSFGTLYHLTWLVRAGHIPRRRARYLDLGSQNIHGDIDEDAARSLYALMGRADAFRPDHIREGVKAEVLLTAAGFDYLAFDTYSAGLTRAFDLNVDKVGWRQRGSFDIVANCGTSEHVANQYNLFKVAHEAMRVGGLMYNHLPFFGQPDHGLISYQPKFFTTLIANNRYQPLYMDFSDIFACLHDRYRGVSSAGNGAAWEDRYIGAAMMNVIFVKRTAAPYRPPTDTVLEGDVNPHVPTVNEIMSQAPPRLPL
jgi:hypothetical protein